ncbi:chalcone-flavanone isomerase family protein [Actinidia rufa]|uniref:Chalcone-flavanone isomerase family protein n=1 Tax=Actinidia rufa TaxID=165716 RepID=A0A7J0GXN1_9ERIC|nr:chalcone-flavanone isomerase family protein [Actinidia rufa]
MRPDSSRVCSNCGGAWLHWRTVALWEHAQRWSETQLRSFKEAVQRALETIVTRFVGVVKIDLSILAYLFGPGEVRTSVQAVVLPGFLFSRVTKQVTTQFGLATAFEKSLRARLVKTNPDTDFNCLRTFGSLFAEDILLHTGTTIDFRQTADGHLITEIGGNQIGAVHSKELCRAFFDMYIGDVPVSEQTKEEIGRNVAILVHWRQLSKPFTLCSGVALLTAFEVKKVHKTPSVKILSNLARIAGVHV